MLKLTIRWERRGMGFDPKEWRKLFTAMYIHLGRLWHRFLLPKHFTHAGATEYGYAPRTRLYTLRKRKKWGHTYPLVWSGATKQAALRTQDVKATSKGAVVTLRGIKKYFWMSQHRDVNNSAKARWGKFQPNMVAEITAGSQRDAAFLSRAGNKFLDEKIRAHAQAAMSSIENARAQGGAWMHAAGAEDAFGMD